MKVLRKLSYAYVCAFYTCVHVQAPEPGWKANPGDHRGNHAVVELGALISAFVLLLTRIFNNGHALLLERGENKKFKRMLRIASPLVFPAESHLKGRRDGGTGSQQAP